ncbi:MAG: pyridine nucleotide transhydrogenase [Alteromonadaceae bacterium]|nr:pyridine nucleotide transhydrogenase [Alteromonadaceae bacterium]
MRKVILASLLFVGAGMAHAETGNDKAFSCMDAKTFEINSSCMVDTISNNVRFKAAQHDIVETAKANSSQNAMATMTFNVEEMTIDIVAHRDALLVRNTPPQ